MSFTAIIILQYGNSRATIECIESVQRYNTAPVRYIVVDNASPDPADADAVGRYLETLPVEAMLVRSPVNDGYARGNNRGLEPAYADPRVDTVLILNNDILFVEDIIPRLRDDIGRLDRCALVSPLLYKPGLTGIDFSCARNTMSFRYMLAFNLLVLHATPGMNRRLAVPVVPYRGAMPVELISGSCIMCRKALFEIIGGFDPGTFLYMEENILSERLRRLDLVSYIDTDIKCIHVGAATISKTRSRAMLMRMFDSQYYFVRNYMNHGCVKGAIYRLSQLWVKIVLTIRHGFRWR